MELCPEYDTKSVKYPGGHSIHMRTGGSVYEVLKQPYNISSA